MSAKPTKSKAEDLPPGWCWLELQRLCTSIADGDHQPPPKAETGIPFLVIGDVSKTRRLAFEDTRLVSRAYFDSLDEARKPKKGDVLYSVTGSFGIPIKVDTDVSFCVQRHLAILRPDEAVGNDYLHLILQSPAVFRQATEIATGTAQKTVPLKGLRRVVVPVAPTSERQRIVEALDSYLTRLDAAAEGLRRVEANLKRYRASVLKAAVEGRLVPTEAELAKREGRVCEPASELLARILEERRRRWEAAELAKMKARGESPKTDAWKTKYQAPAAPDTANLPALPEGWCWAAVDQIGEVSGGVTKNAGKANYGRRLPYLRVANVYANCLRLDEIEEIVVSDGEYDRVLLHAGDLLVVEGNGSLDQIGRVAVWNGSIDPCVHQNHLIKVRMADPKPVRAASWALTWLLSPGGRAEVQRAASSTSGLHTLSLSKVGRLVVPLPPEGEQGRILEVIDDALSLAESEIQAARSTIVRLNRLRQSILTWAFEGKLVEQSPDDEPASVLLDRIREQRSALETGSKPTRASKKKSR